MVAKYIILGNLNKIINRSLRLHRLWELQAPIIIIKNEVQMLKDAIKLVKTEKEAICYQEK